MLRQVRQACDLPDGATAERVRGLAGLSYRDNGLLRRLVITPRPFAAGRLNWLVEVCAEAVQPPEYGLWARFAPAEGLVSQPGEEPRRNFHDYAWPVTGGKLDPDLVRDVTRFAKPMLWFLADTRDLGALMLHPGPPVTRGDVGGYVQGALAARVVGGVMLARATGQPEVEDKARELVASGDVRGKDVQHWAALERAWSPVDISDLETIADVPKYSPEDIRREFARYFPSEPENP